MIDNHVDHPKDCKIILPQNISEFFLHHAKILGSINEYIVILTDDLSGFLTQEKSYTSSEFLKFVSTLKRFGAFNEHLKSEMEEQKQNSTEYDFIWT